MFHQEHIFWLGLLGEGRNVALAEDELGGKLAFRRLQLRLNHPECFCLCLRFDDLLLLMTLCFEDLSLSLGLSDVDVGFLGALGTEDLCALAALSLRLQCHTRQNLVRRLDVSHFVPQESDTPLVSFFGERIDNFTVDLVTLLEGLVEGELSDLTSHGGLCKIDDGLIVVLNHVTSLFSIDHLDVDDTIDLNQHIVLGDTSLRRDRDDLLP